jgi:hypothetical protein
MSKKANTTEEVTQSELIKETDEIVASKDVIESNEIVKPVVSAVNPKTAITRANKSGKMGVYKFLSLYPQDIYIDTLLRWNYPNSFFTKEVWFQKIEELLNKPVIN